MSSPSAKTIKQLFALSKNQCAFPKCTVGIVLEENNTVVGEVCHIKGLRPNAARHDSTQTDDERNAFENLILLCSIHHKIIDEDVESYTVERLRKIKKEREASGGPSALTDDERRDFEALLDQRIQLIIEHEKSKAEQPEQIEQGSGPFTLAKRMAEQRRFEEKRANFFSSYDGFQEVIRSVYAIFASIDRQYEEEKETLSTLGIELHSEEKKRVIATYEFGSHIVLEGFDGSNQNRTPDNLKLEMMLFGRRPVRQPGTAGMFYTNSISRVTFKPDFNAALNAVWVDDKKVIYTEEQLVDKIFNALLRKIEDERKLAQALPEGRYRCGGQYVDIFGNPVREEDEFEDLY